MPQQRLCVPLGLAAAPQPRGAAVCPQVERQLKLKLDPQKAKMLERARAMGATVAPEFEQGACRPASSPSLPFSLQACVTLWPCLPRIAGCLWCAGCSR